VAGEHEIMVRSHLDAPPDRVWARVGTAEGINDELRPFLRMTLPKGLGRFADETIAKPTALGRSWILLFGVLPFDYDDLVLLRLEPGKGFLERSTMLSQRVWEHERTLVPGQVDGCVISDRIRFAPRGPLPAGGLAPVVQAVYRHRHRRLRRHFGGRPL
jgi:ligand-binding SRPBCC domain-containing protein